MTTGLMAESDHARFGVLWCIYALAFLRVLADVSVGTAVPLFVRLVGGSDFVTAFVSAAPAIVYTFAPVVMGRLSDRLGRKKAMAFSWALDLASPVAYLVAWNLPGVVPMGVVVGVLTAGRLNDGVWLALFWPTLQGRLSEERKDGESDAVHGRRLRRYNLSWNAGVVFSQLVLFAATLPASTSSVLANLFALLVASLVLMVAGVALTELSFGDVPRVPASDPSLPSPSPSPPGIPPVVTPAIPPAVEDIRRWRPREGGTGSTSRVWAAARASAVGLASIFAYAFALGAQSANLTNHFTWASSRGAFNLVPLIPLAGLARISAHAAGASAGALPGEPGGVRASDRLAGRLTWTCVPLAGIAVLVAARPLFGVVEAVAFVALLAALGGAAGRVYALAIAHVMDAGRRNHATGAAGGEGNSEAGLYMGLFEATIGFGFLLGPLVAGALTSYLPYHVPYLAGGVAVAVVAAVLRLAGRRRPDPRRDGRDEVGATR
ncbi:MAG: hypothetical protein Kow0069_29070 [Promethearchaeota archaeon]